MLTFSNSFLRSALGELFYVPFLTQLIFFVFKCRLRKMEDRCRALETDKEAILASNAAVRVHAVLML